MPITPITETQINAVLDWFYNERAIDVQGLSNQDNPSFLGKKYVIQSLAFDVTTAVELLASDISNFKINQVIKFTNIADATLSAELDDLVPEQLRITDITGTFLKINLDSSSFVGLFTAGDRLVNTYNSRVLNQAVKQGIIGFELRTGLPFDYNSEHHLDFVVTATLMRLMGRAGAEYRGLSEELEKAADRFKKAKGNFISSEGLEIDENDYDMNNRDMRANFGIEYPSNQGFVND